MGPTGFSVQKGPDAAAVHSAAERMGEAATRVESALAPSFLRRLLGGVARDRVRAVVAAAIEESTAVRRLLLSTSTSASRHAALLEGAGSLDLRAAGQARALVGTCDRILAVVDRWRDAAHSHQDNVIGSDDRLLSVTRRLQTLARDLKPHGPNPRDK